MKVSSRNTTNYTKIAELIKSCANMHVESISISDSVEIKFYNSRPETVVMNEYVQPNMFDKSLVDTELDMGDNVETSGYADKQTSTDSLCDEIEHLALTSPLLSEQLITAQLEKDFNAKDR